MPMKKMILSTILLICVLSGAAVYSVWAQSESAVGVKAGDNFAYSFSVTWVSTNPDVPVPEALSNLNQTMWIKVNVTYAGYTSAGVVVTNVMRDGTQTSDNGTIGVLSGMGTPNAQLLIIQANLTAGKEVYPQSDPEAVAAGAGAESFTITDTLNKTYLGNAKTVNHYYVRNTNATTGDYGERDAYYDQATGVLMEMTTTHYNAALDEIDAEHWRISQFNNAGTIPSDGGNNNGANGTNSNGGSSDLLTLVSIGAVVAVVVVLTAVVMLRRKKKPQTPEAPPANPFAAPTETLT